MRSQSLDQWRIDRMPRLQEVENQCATTLTLNPPNPFLADGNLRGFTALLSAHFQGFCRDLYAESSLIIAAKVEISLRTLIQAQFFAHCSLDRGNPNLSNITEDFSRLGFKLNLSADRANQPRLQDLASLNRWRNIVAHQGKVPPSGFPSLSLLQSWRNSCDGLATSLDTVMYNQLRNVLKRRPWIP